MAEPFLVKNALFSVISVGKKQLPPPGARQPRRQVGERAGWLVGWSGLAWLGLAWLGLAWLGLAWLGLAWLGLAWLG